jgi:hypothetical protein
MARPRVILALVAAACAASCAAGEPSACASRCRFDFCPENYARYDVLGTPDEPFTNAICDAARNEYVGIVGRTGEAVVQVPGGGRVPISKWRPDGLLEPFADSFFKSYIVAETHSGVGRQIAQQNQLGFLNRTCFELEVVDYQKLSWDGKVVLENAHVSGSADVDCVAFMTSL